MAQAFYKPDGSLAITERWNTANYATTQESTGRPSGATGTHSFKTVLSTSAARYAYSIDDAGTPSGDVEAVTRFYYEHTSDGGSLMRLLLHGGGAAGSEDAYFVDQGINVGGSADSTSISEYDGGTAANLDVDITDKSITRNAWFRIRIQRTSTTIRGRIWADGDSEPGTWIVSATDATHSSGWVGLGTFLSAGALWVDWIGVGTGGDTAPSEPVGGVIPAIMHHRRMLGVS